MDKTPTRQIAEQIQKFIGKDLIWINWCAQQYISAGLCKDTKEALEYMLKLEHEDLEKAG